MPILATAGGGSVRGFNPGGAKLEVTGGDAVYTNGCLLYTSPSPRDGLLSRMPSSA